MKFYGLNFSVLWKSCWWGDLFSKTPNPAQYDNYVRQPQQKRERPKQKSLHEVWIWVIYAAVWNKTGCGFTKTPSPWSKHFIFLLCILNGNSWILLTLSAGNLDTFGVNLNIWVSWEYKFTSRRQNLIQAPRQRLNKNWWKYNISCFVVGCLTLFH